MDLSEITGVFLQESDELLEAMEQTLLRLERDSNDPEAVHAVFRAVHTIKGSGSMFGFTRVADFAHVTETLLDTIRTGGLALDADLVQLLMQSRDHLVRLVRAAPDESASEDPELITATADLVKLIQALDPATQSFETFGNAGLSNTPQQTEAPASIWTIDLRFGAEVFRQRLDPRDFVRHLRELGSIRDVRTVANRLPAFSELEPESCYLDFRIILESAASETELRSVFQFVEAYCEIAIQENRPAEETVSRTAAPEQNGARTIRVESIKLDHLVNLVGELVVSMARLNQLADDSERPEIVEASYGMLKLISEIRDGAFGLRMFSIGTLFNRFRRVVRDAAAGLEKSVRLEIEGAETRLDKAMIEKIADPLMHLVRNAVDHGIESPAVRVEAGKNPEGRILLNAYNEAGEIVIEITDDGAGLSRERILSRAIERGLVPAGIEMGDAQAFELIFLPGMSTAEKITGISGRGVGMDVVRKNIEALRGRVELQSPPGAGTTVRIRLPLTLAIIDGFLVRIGASHFVFPLDLVEECMEFDTREYSERNRIMATREGPLPVVELKDFFQLETPDDGTPPRAMRQSLVVVRHAGSRVGLVVDELLGEYQSVIKPLGSFFDGLRALSGATILGNGAIAIVLDVPALLKWCDGEAVPTRPVDLRGVQSGLEGAGV